MWYLFILGLVVVVYLAFWAQDSIRDYRTRGLQLPDLTAKKLELEQVRVDLQRRADERDPTLGFDDIVQSLAKLNAEHYATTVLIDQFANNPIRLAGSDWKPLVVILPSKERQATKVTKSVVPARQLKDARLVKEPGPGGTWKLTAKLDGLEVTFRRLKEAPKDSFEYSGVTYKL